MPRRRPTPRSPPPTPADRFTEALARAAAEGARARPHARRPAPRRRACCCSTACPAKGYASHGESWSFALALRLASAELLRRDSTTGDPVLILDDVFAELDRMRRARLAAAIGGFEQVLVTAAVLEDVPEPLTARIVHIEAGRIVEEEEATTDA